MTKKRWLAFAAIAWLAAVCTSFVFLVRYKSTSGDEGRIAASWPADSKLARWARPTLVMFAHPKCACTRASLTELRTVLSERGDAIDAYVVFYDGENSWRTSDVHRDAESIPGLRVIDDDGHEAKAFGAVTSGHVALYAPNGALRYTGGITGSRGHVGDNAGRDRLVAAIDGPGELAMHPVFGCLIAPEIGGRR